MDSDKRLLQLEEAFALREDICISRGIINSFPSVLYKPFRIEGVGLIVCKKGNFSFTVMSEVLRVHEEEMVFLPEDALFSVVEASSDLEIYLLFYSVANIRDLLGNLVQQMQLYVKMSPTVYYVWSTNEAITLINYMKLIENTINKEDNQFLLYEQRLLLLSLTYRLCSVYQSKFLSHNTSSQRKTEIFLQLIQLIDHYYMSERGVSFYANRLYLSPKYLSELSKSVCGYTVQELVFKTIMRKCMALLNGTTKTVQEISEEFNFPNPSSFGTFFKKQTGLSPFKYRMLNKR